MGAVEHKIYRRAGGRADALRRWLAKLGRTALDRQQIVLLGLLRSTVERKRTKALKGSAKRIHSPHLHSRRTGRSVGGHKCARVGRACVRVCVRARACVSVCVCACVRVRVCVYV